MTFASDARIVAEVESEIGGVKSATAAHAMAVTANPHATAAALKILKKGGSAVDAAIAAQLVLGLVEPQSSGIGGGAFMLLWDAQQRRVSSWDGREEAPAAVAENHFLDASGKPMDFYDAVIGGHAVGVPGVVAMLWAAHQAHGVLPWAELFTPAITLAKHGFQISPRLYTLLEKSPKLAVNPEIQAYFFNKDGDGFAPKPVGALLKNPAYAQSLKAIAEGGVAEFYRGALAAKIVQAVQRDPNRAGLLSESDMASYAPRIQAPICAPYRQYQVCGAPPPSSGGTTVLGILGILDARQSQKKSFWQHDFIESSRLAFADRNRYVADPVFTPVPTDGLVNTDYLNSRAALLSDQRLASVTAGQPPGAVPVKDGISKAMPSTSHLSIVDAKGNILSMTTSIETAFGSRIMVGGFLLNNQLTDFSFAPKGEAGELIANRIEAGKRPRSSMSPTLVFERGEPLMAIGSPGGARIIDYVAGSLFKVLGLGWDLAPAIASGHIVAMGDFLELEQGQFSEAQVQAISALGHKPKLAAETSGLHGIMRVKGGWYGVADPRREGVAQGF
ncbi:gamma-glutamyltransferase [Spongiibacter pelagi]|nr:gamma-glutamyltransferase [Spongiibacter pelagi]